jgi:hypothetical protein
MPTPNPNVAGPGPYRTDDAAWGCGWAWLWFWLFIIVIAFAGWGWGGWYGGWGGPWGWWGPPYAYQAPVGPETMEPRPSATQPGTGAGEFLGKTVTLSGQVDQVLGPRTFTLARAQGGRDLLVITKDDKAPAVKKGETVRITGIVEKYDAREIHQQTGADLTKVPANEFAGRPAVVASSVSANAGAS